MDHLIKEVTEVHLNTNNFKSGSGFILIWDWYFINDMFIKRQEQAGRALDPVHQLSLAHDKL
jgi:hypothetical protein